MITCTYRVHDFKTKNHLSRTPKNMLSKSILIGLFVPNNNRTIEEPKSLQGGWERQLSSHAFLRPVTAGTGNWVWVITRPVTDSNPRCKGYGFESHSEPEFFSGHFSSSVMAAFASFILSLFNYYCWICITMEFIYLSRVLRPLNIKGPTHT